MPRDRRRALSSEPPLREGLAEVVVRTPSELPVQSLGPGADQAVAVGAGEAVEYAGGHLIEAIMDAAYTEDVTRAFPRSPQAAISW